jgi:hypothetical protein
MAIAVAVCHAETQLVVEARAKLTHLDVYTNAMLRTATIYEAKLTSNAFTLV